MKKTLKLVPVSLLAVCALVSCNNNNSSSDSGDSTTTTPVVKDTLTDFVNKLAEGEQSKDTIDALLADDELLASNDSLVTETQYRLIDNLPATYLEDDEKEDAYSRDQSASFNRFSNNVVATTISSSYKGYDATTEDNFGEASKYSGIGYLYEDSDGKTRYTYTQDSDAENVYSFSYAKKISDEDKTKFYNAGGLNGDVAYYADYAEQFYDYLANAYSTYSWVECNLDYEAIKEGNKLTVSYFGEARRYFSLEWSWGHKYTYDDEGNITSDEKISSSWDNFYITNGFAYTYSFTIEDGILTSAVAAIGGFTRAIYEDTAKAYTPDSPWALEIEDVKKMTLTIPEKIVSPSSTSGEKINNPYKDPTELTFYYDDMFTYFIVRSSKKSLGKFDTTKLPDPTSYRSDIEGDDIGAWISVQDLVDCDEAE